MTSPVYSPGLAPATDLGALESAAASGVGGGAGAGGGGYTTAAADSAALGTSGTPMAPSGVNLVNAGGVTSTNQSLLGSLGRFAANNPRMTLQLAQQAFGGGGSRPPTAAAPPASPVGTQATAQGAGSTTNPTTTQTQNGAAARAQTASELAMAEANASRIRQQQLAGVATDAATRAAGENFYSAANAGVMNDANTADYLDSFRPVNRMLAEEALNAGSRQQQETAAGEAAVDIERAIAGQRAAENRSMAAMGVNPDSSRFAGMAPSRAIDAAAARVAAQNNARKTVQTNAQNLRLNVAGLGQNVGNLAIGSGESAGNLATNGARLMQTGYDLNRTGTSDYISNLGGAVDLGRVGSGISLAEQGLGLDQQRINNQNSQFNQQIGLDRDRLNTARDSANGQAIGSGLAWLFNDGGRNASTLWNAAGTAGSAIGSAWDSASSWLGDIFSDEDSKHNKRKVDHRNDTKAIRKMRVERWNYKPETGMRQDAQQGTYAQDFKKATGMGDGRTIPIGAQMGVMMGAIKDIDRRLAKKEKSA